MFISHIFRLCSVIDMDEAALCMDELKAPWFHSKIVSQWVTDSFDRNNVERDLLAKLLIYLCNEKPNLLSHEQLLTGLVLVLGLFPLRMQA
jgi:translation initiation factor 4G